MSKQISVYFSVNEPPKDQNKDFRLKFLFSINCILSNLTFCNQIVYYTCKKATARFGVHNNNNKEPKPKYKQTSEYLNEHATKPLKIHINVHR